MSAAAQAQSAREALDDFGEFYLATWDDAYRLALAITRDRASALDVAQDAFLAAYAARGKFRGQGPALHWILRIVANKATSYGRAQTRLGRLRARAISELRSDGDRAPEEWVSDRLAIEKGFDLLTPQQRAVVVLRYVHDLDYASIGQILGITTSNVGVTLTRSLARLRRAFDREGSTSERQR